jgi:hypothetical protein
MYSEVDKISQFGFSSPKNQVRSIKCPIHEDSFVIAVCTLPNCQEGVMLCPECSLERPEHAFVHKSYIEMIPLFLSKRSHKLLKLSGGAMFNQHKAEISQCMQDVNRHLNEIEEKFNSFSRSVLQDIQSHLESINAKMRELVLSKDFTSLSQLKEKLTFLDSFVTKSTHLEVPSAQKPLSEEILKALINGEEFRESNLTVDFVSSSLSTVKFTLEEMHKKSSKLQEVEGYYGRLRESTGLYFKNILSEMSNLNDLTSLPLLAAKDQQYTLYHSKNSDINSYPIPGNKHVEQQQYTTTDTVQGLPTNTNSNSSKENSSCQSGSKGKSQKSSDAPELMKIVPSKEEIELSFQTYKQLLSTASHRVLDDVARAIPNSLFHGEKFSSDLSDKLRLVKHEILNNLDVPKRTSLTKEIFNKILTIIPEQEFAKVESKPGQYYYGGIRNNIRDGIGISINPGQSIYFGEYINGVQHGVGLKLTEEGEFYEGQWEAGERQGQGYLSLPESECDYYGEFFKGLKHGRGYEKRKDGTIFIGHFQRNLKDGRGVCIWAVGEKYEGTFKENRIEGNGIYSWHDGSIYIGDWKNSMMHGKGMLTDADGGQYVGDFKEDLKDGYGCFTWKDKWIYRGNWVKGVQNGTGVEVEPDGRTRLGQWVNGDLMMWLEE